MKIFLFFRFEIRWWRDFQWTSQNGPRTSPDSCKMGTGPNSRRWSGRGVVLVSHPSSSEVMQKYGFNPTHPKGHKQQ